MNRMQALCKSQSLLVADFGRDIPDVHIEGLKGLPFWSLFNVARIFSPQKDSSSCLRLDVTQVRTSRTLDLFVHVEWLQRLV